MRETREIITCTNLAERVGEGGVRDDFPTLIVSGKVRGKRERVCEVVSYPFKIHVNNKYWG